MKKRVNRIIVVLALILFWVFSSTAQAAGTATVSFRSNKTVLRVGEQAVVTSRINSDEPIAVYSMAVLFDSHIWQVVSVKGMNTKPGEFSYNIAGNKIIVLYLDNDGGTTALPTGEKDVFQITFLAKAGGNTTITAEDAVIGVDENTDLSTTVQPLALSVVGLYTQAPTPKPTNSQTKPTPTRKKDATNAPTATNTPAIQNTPMVTETPMASLNPAPSQTQKVAPVTPTPADFDTATLIGILAAILLLLSVAIRIINSSKKSL